MSKPFSVSDLVVFRGCTCIINKVSDDMGYHIYGLTNLDTGHQQRGFRYELSHVEPEVVDMMVGGDIMEFAVPEVVPSEIGRKEAPGRFADVTEADLVGLEEKRISKNTQSQTSWGVKIFRGKISTMCVCLFTTGCGRVDMSRPREEGQVTTEYTL